MNHLHQLDEFKKVLSSYKMSDKSSHVLESTPFVTMAAISSTGRNTIIRELLKTNNYYFIVSDTTRKPRVNDGILEQNGVEYWFREEQDVLDDLQSGKFVEAALIHNQQVSGVSTRELEEANSKNKIAISDIEVQGVHTFRKVSPNIIPIFLLPPSYAEWKRRLNGRGKMTDNELHNRISSAKQELSMALEQDYYHFLINDNLVSAVKGVDKIAHGILDESHEQEGRRIAKQILRELNDDNS